VKNPYPNEKFSNAILSMATSTARIQDRIRDAYVYQLIHVNVEDLPESVRGAFLFLEKELDVNNPIGGKGSVEITTEQMSTEKAIDIAQQIFGIFQDIQIEYYESIYKR
jgi:hypothetical protein